MFRPTNPSIDPPTHQNNTHPWVRNSPQIPNLQTESKYLDSFKSYHVFTDLGVPPLGVGWVGGWGWGWVGRWVGLGLGGGTPMHMHTHTHAYACMCVHTCMHVKHDKHGCLHGGGHLQFPNMFILAFRGCACVHVCVHVSRDTPMPPDSPQPICSLPRAAGSHREPKSPKVYKS